MLSLATAMCVLTATPIKKPINAMRDDRKLKTSAKAQCIPDLTKIIKPPEQKNSFIILQYYMYPTQVEPHGISVQTLYSTLVPNSEQWQLLVPTHQQNCELHHQ